MSDAAPIEFPSLSSPSPSGSSATAQTKFYHTHAGKPFSRSAAKRQSVIALGSIAHLQHKFVRLGLAATTKPKGSGMVLAIPGGLVEEVEDDLNPLTSSALKRSETRPRPTLEELPPTPMRPEIDERMPWEKEENNGRSVKGEKELRRDVLAGLEDVCQKWGLAIGHSRLSSDVPDLDDRSFELPAIPAETLLVLELLQTTTATIRSVQRYCVSLPSDAFKKIALSPTPPDLDKQTKMDSDSDFVRTTSAMLGTQSPGSRISNPFLVADNTRLSLRSSSSSLSAIFSASALSSAPFENPLQTLRKSSLEVLGALQSMETRFRTEARSRSHSTMSDELGEIPDELDDLPPLIPSSSSEEGSPRVSLRGPSTPEDGFIYRSEVCLVDLIEEADVVRKYVATVDKILFKDRRRAKRVVKIAPEPIIPPVVTVEENKLEAEVKDKIGHRRRAKVDAVDVSLIREEVEQEPEEMTHDTEEEEEDDEDDELPPWATDGVVDLFVRAHSILVSHLPDNLLSRIADPVNRTDFLDSLSDGTLLCNVYNAVLRSSARPFGFIPLSSIHEIDLLSPDLGSSVSSREARASLDGTEQKQRVGQTFRRAENLRVFAGAFKFRYLVNLKSAQINFEEKVVARKLPGWEDMIARALNVWVTCVVAEKRDEFVVV